MALISKAKQALALLPPTEGAGIVVGFSGGADSTALLSFLCFDCGLLPSVTAVHINHGLRGKASDDDEAFCRRFCREKGIAFRAEKVNVRASCGGAALEETARTLRYAALQKVADEVGATRIALAHTANDNAETVLFHLVRGCGTRGAAGIPLARQAGRQTVIRPLLFCTREEVEAYCSSHRYFYVTDETNTDTAYARNYIRHEIVPRLEKLNPAFIGSIRSFSLSLSEDERFLEEEAARFCRTLPVPSSAPIEALMSLAKPVRARVLMQLAKAVDCTPLSAHIEETEQILSHPEGGARVMLPGDTVCLAADGFLTFYRGIFFRRITEEEPFSLVLKEGENRIRENRMIFLSMDGDDDRAQAAGKDFAFSAVKGFCLPEGVVLLARTPTKADAYRAGKITRKIHKLKTEVPYLSRFLRPVLCADNEPVWYPGFDMADHFKGASPTVFLYYFENIT